MTLTPFISPAHVERGYAAPIPGMLFFYCDRPADEAGETTLYDGFEVFNRMSEEAQQFFATNKMRYQLRIGPELWQRTLMTDDRSEALFTVDEELGRAVDRSNGESASSRVDGDVLVMDFVTPATRRTPRGSGPANSNSGLTFLYSLGLKQEGLLANGKMDLRTEDGGEFPMRFLDEALQASEAAVVKIKWSKGDLLCLDNRTVLHGRAAFTDPERRVYVRIGFGIV